ncbi:MAG TPA: hypothetical protein VGA17_06465 [Nitrospiraceae bacterium]
MRPLWTRVAIAGAFVILAGCASTGDVSQLKLTPWPPGPTKAKKTVRLTYGGGVFNQKGDIKRRHYVAPGTMCRTTDEIGTVVCNKQTGVPPAMLQAFQESGFFSEVKTDNSETDLQVQVKTVVRNRENSGGAVLVGLSLFLLPGKIMDHALVLRATFKDRDGKVLGKAEGRATGGQWLGLMSLFMLPFRDMTFEETETAAYKAILIDAHEKGII